MVEMQNQQEQVLETTEGLTISEQVDPEDIIPDTDKEKKDVKANKEKDGGQDNKEKMIQPVNGKIEEEDLGKIMKALENLEGADASAIRKSLENDPKSQVDLNVVTKALKSYMKIIDDMIKANINKNFDAKENLQVTYTEEDRQQLIDLNNDKKVYENLRYKYIIERNKKIR